MKKWILATRPWSFPASMMPALLALAYVFYLLHTGDSMEVNPFNGLMALIGVVIFQAAGNLISDYYDFQFGVDRKGTYGSSQLIVEGTFTSRTILKFGFGLLLAGILVGLYLCLKTDFILLFIGLFGVIGTLFYYRFKYHALGDLVIFVLYGMLIALGTMYVVTGRMEWQLLFVSLPVGLLVVNILQANNTRDIENDRKAGITTLAMRLGITASKVLYQVIGISAYLITVLLIIGGILPYHCLIIFLSLPILIRNMTQIRKIASGHLELIKDLDKDSAKLVMVFSLLLIMGIISAIYV